MLLATLTGSALAQQTLPYFEDFEAGPGGWNGAGDWQHGTPSAAPLNTANSGTNVWGTNLTGSYQNLAEDFLVSPQFDFSSATADPILTFAMNRVYEGTSTAFDGMLLEVSIGGGPWTLVGNIGTGTNWYTHVLSTSFSNPRGGQPVWGGSSNGWIVASHALSGTAGSSDVRIRFVHATDSSVPNPGVLIDDVEIVDPTVPQLRVRDAAGNDIAHGAARAIGIHPVGNASSVTLTLANLALSGTQTLDITGISFSNLTQVGATTATPTTVTGIMPSTTDSVTIGFTAQTFGSFSFDVEFIHNGINSPYSITLEGLAGPAIELVDPQSATLAPGGTFSDPVVRVAGAGNTYTFTIHNTGHNPLDVSSIQAVASNNITVNNISPASFTGGNEIAPGGTETFTVDVTAGTSGPFSCDIEITHSGVNVASPLAFIISGGVGFVGTVTVNNAGGAMYSDLGALFNDLEAFGLAGPTDVIVSEGTGPYTSSIDYRLSTMPGQGPSNPLTIRAAQGEQPVIDGGFAMYSYMGGGLTVVAFSDVANVVFEGFTLSAANQPDAFVVVEYGDPTLGNVVIRRCRMDGFAPMGSISLLDATAAGAGTVTVENCLITGAEVGILVNEARARILHNTIGTGPHPTFGDAWAAFQNVASNTGSKTTELFSNNIIMTPVPGPAYRQTNAHPIAANSNVWYIHGGGTFGAGAITTFNGWRAAGYDSDGMLANPLFLDPDNGDYRLRYDSPAVDATAVSFGITTDLAGTTRTVPNDTGAYEFDPTEPAVEVQGPMGVDAPFGGTVVLPKIGQGVPMTFVFTVRNVGGGTLTLGPIATPNVVNATILSITPPITTTVASGDMTTFAVELESTANINDVVTFDIEFSTNVPNRNPFTFAAEGTVVIPAPEISVQRPANTVIPSGGVDTIEGIQIVGNPQEWTYTIANIGSAMLNLTGTPLVALSNPVNCVATVMQPPASSSINLQSSLTFVVRVTPSNNGPFSFQVTINSDDAANNPYIFTVEGEAARLGLVEVMETEIDFGNPEVFHSTTRTLTIRNVGSGKLTISSLLLRDANGFWSLAGISPALPLLGATIVLDEAGLGEDEVTLTFRFSPTEPSPTPFEATLIIETDSAGEVGTRATVRFTGNARQQSIAAPSSGCAALGTPGGQPAGVALGGCVAALLGLLALALVRRRQVV